MPTITHTGFNQLDSLILGQAIDLANVAFMLLSSGYSFDATDTTIDDVAGAAGPHRANEVYGNGWTEGGEVLASVAISIVSTSHAKLTAANIDKTASGGDIGPAPQGVFYDATSGSVLSLVEFGEDRTAEEGTNMLVVPDTLGLINTIPPS